MILSIILFAAFMATFRLDRDLKGLRRKNRGAGPEDAAQDGTEQ